MSEGRNVRGNQSPGRGHGPMGPMGRPVEKPKDFKGTFKRLMGYLRPHRTNLIIVLIFAIASTIFTIAAPKVTSKAMNKLQDAYMARKMLSEMSEGQNEAVDEMQDKMGDVQEDVVEQIKESMIEAQQKSVDKITESMGDAQEKSVNEMYKAIAIQLHNGVVTGQKTAVDKITVQMGSVQKGMVAQIQQQMQQPSTTEQPQDGTEQAPTQQIDPKTLEAMQELMKLPMIDSISDRSTKVKTTLQFIDILQTMPPNGQMNTKSLATTEELLKLPMLSSVKNSNQKVTIIKKFMSIAKQMPGGS